MKSTKGESMFWKSHRKICWCTFTSKQENCITPHLSIKNLPLKSQSPKTFMLSWLSLSTMLYLKGMDEHEDKLDHLHGGEVPFPPKISNKRIIQHQCNSMWQNLLKLTFGGMAHKQPGSSRGTSPCALQSLGTVQSHSVLLQQTWYFLDQ